MFKRPHSSKTTTPIRSSDLRKLRDEVLRVLPGTNEVIKSLVPDQSLAGKATTHLDEPLTIYYAPPSSSTADPDPRWFRLGKGNDGQLVPTCYSFDLLPSLLPQLETAEAVVDNLQSGSALFTAGVSLRSLKALPDTIQPGDLVSVVVYDQPQTVVAVGHLGASKRELLKDDKKGKAVLTLHARGDYLWESGSTTGPATSLPPPSTAQPEPDLSTSLASASISTPLPSSSSPEETLTPSQVDDILHRALLLSLQSLPPSSFPLAASSLYSSHILPNRPLEPSSASTVDLKRSNYKKLTGLIKFAHKKGWLVSKEVRGETIVMSANRDHDDVQNLRAYKTVSSAQSESGGGGGGGGGETTTTTTTATNKNGSTDPTTASSTSSTGVVVNEYFKPSGSTIKQILSSIPDDTTTTTTSRPLPPGDLYSVSNLKHLFLSYLNLHSLVHPNSQKHFSIVPNPTTMELESISYQELLVSVLLKKGERVEDFKEGVMTKDEGFKRFVASGGFTEYWGLRKGRGGEEEQVQRGSPPTIKVAIKNVGKRQVTLISNHESWSDLIGGGNGSESLSEELKRKSASSVSIQPLAGSAKKNQTPKVEIMCQGTHDKLVSNLLISKGVPKKYIEIDLSKSKK